jgi:hypothetical protein
MAALTFDPLRAVKQRLVAFFDDQALTCLSGCSQMLAASQASSIGF